MTRISSLTALLVIGLAAPAVAQQLGGVHLGAEFDATSRRLASEADSTFAVDREKFGECRGFLFSDRRLAICESSAARSAAASEVVWIRVWADREEFGSDLVGTLGKTYNGVFSAHFGSPVVENENSVRPGPTIWRWQTERLRARVSLETRDSMPHQVDVLLERR